MRHGARFGGWIGRRTVVRPSFLHVCRTYRFTLPGGHGHVVFHARRWHGLERRTLSY
jgi:hypothetical protein